MLLHMSLMWLYLFTYLLYNYIILLSIFNLILFILLGI